MGFLGFYGIFLVTSVTTEYKIAFKNAKLHNKAFLCQRAKMPQPKSSVGARYYLLVTFNWATNCIPYPKKTSIQACLSINQACPNLSKTTSWFLQIIPISSSSVGKMDTFLDSYIQLRPWMFGTLGRAQKRCIYRNRFAKVQDLTPWLRNEI